MSGAAMVMNEHPCRSHSQNGRLHLPARISARLALSRACRAVRHIHAIDDNGS